MVHYKLYYFDIEGGSGGAIRNTFKFAKIPFEDIRVKHADWPALKATAKCVYGQMPLLDIDGKCYAQSMSILRYVGKLAGLYPTDPIEALRVDELLDSIVDVRAKLSPTYGMPEADRIAARQKLVEDFIKPRYAAIECRVNQDGSPTGFAVGNKLTIADIALATEVEGLRSGRLDGLDKTILDNSSGLLKIVENVKKVLAEL